MQEFRYTIQNPAGIHAIPAGQLVKVLQMFQSAVYLTLKATTVDCKAPFKLVGLGVKCGETVTVTVQGTDEDAAIEVIRAYFEQNL